jgi:anaerobic magnesium-protoporphyrin IX monomethyl ester cyclase
VKVLLVQPPVSFEDTYPLGLAYIAGYLRRHDVEVDGFDVRLGGPRGLARRLADESYDLVGISAYSSNLAGVAAAAEQVRELQPGAITVLGGPHGTLGLDPPPGRARPLFDYVVRGDGEQPLLALARGAQEGPGIWAPSSGKQAEIHIHSALEDLDFPDRTTFPIGPYYGGALKRGRWTAVIASRGCSWRCAYCSAARLGGGRQRRRRVESVLEELHRLRVDHKVDGVQLEDDNLFLDRPWATSLLDGIATSGLGLSIQLPNGTDPMLLDEDLIALAAHAGVDTIALGVETLRPETQQALRRAVDPEHLRKVIEACRSHGIRVGGFFIIGLPGDSVDGVLAMYREVRRLGLDLAHVSVFQDLPALDMESGAARFPGGAAGLEALRRLFYVYYYAHPRTWRAALRQAGPSPMMVGRAARRFLAWARRPI